MSMKNLALFLLATILNQTLNAQPATPADSPKQKMECGVFPVALYDFDVANHEFSTSFYLWCNAPNADIKLDKTLEVVNALSYESKYSDQSPKDGKSLTQTRYFAKVYHEWDMTSFPFDRQTLKVHLEDGVNDINALRFIPDIQNSKVASDLILNGWKLENFKLSEEPHDYASGFGSGRDKSTYSRMTLTFDIKRQGMRNFINYFLGFFVAALLSAFACIIATDRFSFILAAIFALIGNKYVLDQLLPATASFTLSDNLQLATFVYVMGTSLFVALDTMPDHAERKRFRFLSPKMAVIGLFVYTVYCGAYSVIAMMS